MARVSCRRDVVLSGSAGAAELHARTRSTPRVSSFKLTTQSLKNHTDEPKQSWIGGLKGGGKGKGKVRHPKKGNEKTRRPEREREK